MTQRAAQHFVDCNITLNGRSFVFWIHIFQPDKEAAQPTPSVQEVVEGQRENLLYKEDLGFLAMWKDPRYIFYRKPKKKKERFVVKNEDVLYAIEKFQFLTHLEFLQISRSNKSIEVRFNSERSPQHFLDFNITLNGNNFAFHSNAQRGLRVSIHGAHPSISDTALQYKLKPYFGSVLDNKMDRKQYKNIIYQTGP